MAAYGTLHYTKYLSVLSEINNFYDKKRFERITKNSHWYKELPVLAHWMISCPSDEKWKDVVALINFFSWMENNKPLEYRAAITSIFRFWMASFRDDFDTAVVEK